jgi:hypothetical protein
VSWRNDEKHDETLLVEEDEKKMHVHLFREKDRGKKTNGHGKHHYIHEK